MIDLKLGDCLELMDDIKDNSIDCVICDPPYGTLNSRKIKWDVIIPFDKLWNQYNRILKDDGTVLLFGIEPFSSLIRMSNLNSYRYDLYWHKTLCSNFVMGKKQPFFKIETISVFYNKKVTYNPQIRDGKPYKVLEKHIEQNGLQQKYCFNHKSDIINDGNRLPDNLLEFNSVGGKTKLHPTQKPIELIEYLIKTYSNENDLILDNCMGSGTTGVACKRLNRDFIGIELDENYFNIAKQRIENERVIRNIFK